MRSKGEAYMVRLSMDKKEKGKKLTIHKTNYIQYKFYD